MSENFTESEVDASSSAGTDSPEPASSQPSQDSGGQQEAATQQTQEQEKALPFHEHPRFKELIEQKNEYSNQLKSAQSQMQEMYNRLQQLEQSSKPQKQADPLLSRLKQIDPEFGERFEKLASLEQQVGQFQQWQQQQENDRIRNEYESKLDSLFKNNSISDERKQAYRDSVESTIFRIESSGQKLGVKDVERIFKDVHNNYSKFFTDYERKIKESYVTDKKKDATPATQTGGKSAPLPTGDKLNTDQIKDALARGIRQMQQKV